MFLYVIKEVTFSKATFEGLHKDSRSGILDIVCIDERNDTFIVEMQGIAKDFFLNRLEFYAFHRLDSLVRKGKFDFNIKEKIYGIAFLGTNISEVKEYHNVLSWKNQNGVPFPNIIQYVTVELEKFILTADEVKTDLEKLVFTVKNAHKMTTTLEKPTFGEEDWLNIPMGELDIRTLSPERFEAYQYWLVHEAEAKRLDEERKAEAERKGRIEGERKGKLEGKIITLKDLIKDGTLTIKNLVATGKHSEDTILKVKELLIAELLEEGMIPLSNIAQIAEVSEAFVRNAAHNIAQQKDRE